MMDDGEILQALQEAATAAVAASSTPTLAIKYLGRTFIVPSDQKWLELVFIPNTPDNQFFGGEKNYMGMFRLILHWPNDDAGVYGPINVLKSIAGYFTKDRWLNGVKITNEPNMQTPIADGTEALYAAFIRYSAFRQGA
jgi:hypothetical protein